MNAIDFGLPSVAHGIGEGDGEALLNGLLRLF